MRFFQKITFSLTLTFLLVSALASAPALGAAEPELLGTYTDWTAYVYGEKGGKVCYMAGTPVKETGKYKRRGDVFVLVTNRTAGKSRRVVSFAAGYTYKKNSETKIRIGGNKFKLFTDGNKAWAYDDVGDKKLIAAMQRGRAMIVSGTSSRGTVTTDTYSLTGFSAAVKAIDKACGFK